MRGLRATPTWPFIFDRPDATGGVSAAAVAIAEAAGASVTVVDNGEPPVELNGTCAWGS